MPEILRSCPLCELGDFTELYVTRDRHYGISGSFRVVRCVHCSLVFLNPMYSSGELKGLYPTDYYAYQDKFQRIRWKELLKKVLGYVTLTKDPHFETPGSVLDLGCGSGWFLQRMRASGWVTYGVEINSAAAALGKDSKGLNIFCGTLEEAKYPSEFFDYVRSNHSFEHISNPNDTLKELHRILKPSGKLLVCVPNINSLSYKVFGKFWWYLGVPVHPFNYSRGTLSHLLAKHGFRVERICFNSDYFGFAGSFQIWLNRNKQKKSIEGAVANSHTIQLICQWLAKITDFVCWGDEIEITAVRRDSSV